MGELFGLDCQNPKCVHDSVRAYRLRFLVRPDMMCVGCQRTGVEIPVNDVARLRGVEALDAESIDDCRDWWRCSLVDLSNLTAAAFHAKPHEVPPCYRPWRRRLQAERNDMIFRAHQLDAALAQMELLGATSPGVGAQVVDKHPSLPPGFDQRLLILREEPMPRLAIYFRWQPATGELLRPDMCCQGIFAPDMTADQRRQALVRRLLPEEFEELFKWTRQARTRTGRLALETVTASRIRCQHCTQPLPLRTFSSATLREAQWGD